MTDAFPTTRAPKGGLDANLELPLADPYLVSLFKTENCQIASLLDLDKLTAALLKHQYDFSYLPSANCFFLRNDHAWRGLSSALSPRTKLPAQSSVFVVKSSPGVVGESGSASQASAYRMSSR